MGDIYYPPPLQSFAYSSYPAQLSNPDHNNAQASAGSYLAALQSQLRETGQVNAELLRQHQMASGGGMHNDGRMMMSGAQGNGWAQQQHAGPSSYLQQHQQQQQYASGSNSGPIPIAMRPQAQQQRHQSTPPPSSADEHSLSPQLEEETAPVRAASKRGRKKKGKMEEQGDAEHLDDLDDDEGARGKRGRRPSLNANEKRKLQNRAAQRAFRERKEKHVRDLEEKVAAQDDQLHAFRDMITRLQTENDALRRGENVPLTSFSLPPPPDFPSRRSSHSQISASEAHPSPPNLCLPSPPLPPHPVPAPTMQSYSFAQSPDTGINEPTMTLSRTPVSMERGGETPEPYASYNRSKTGYAPANYLTSTAPTPMNSSDDMNFDFDAPFDFSNAVPLPPLFQDLFDASFPAASSASTADDMADDCCPGDTDDAPALPGGRLPCDKPECDFSVISCALPIPWRPQAVGSGVGDKETWVCKQAWGKLCSHPMFGQCDVDELCRELRDRTRCSDDGRLVIPKSEVCEVFKSIPGRARARREAEEMREGGRV